MNDLFGTPAPRRGKPAPSNGKPAPRNGTPGETGYTAASIEVLEGLEPVRRRPGMYVGGTDSNALHHLFAEVIDNAMDEAVAGHATFIEVSLEESGYLSVLDNGRGTTIQLGVEQRVGPLALRGGVARDQRKRVQIGAGTGLRFGPFSLDVGFLTHSSSLSNSRGITMATSISIY